MTEQKELLKKINDLAFDIQHATADVYVYKAAEQIYHLSLVKEERWMKSKQVI
ncbi:hypothetical protein ACYSNR_04300 [Enterococcus sp. LJL128]